MKNQVIEAVYRDGLFHPLEPVELAPEAHVRLVVRDSASSEVTGEAMPARRGTGADLLRFFGCVEPSGEDPVAVQRRMREEWDEREKERLAVADKAIRA